MQDLEKWKISNQRQFMHNDGEGFLIGFHYDDVVGLINRLQAAEKRHNESREIIDNLIGVRAQCDAYAAELKALREQKPVAYADPQAFINFDNATQNKEWMWCSPDAGLVPVYAKPVAQSRDSDKPAIWMRELGGLLDESTTTYSIPAGREENYADFVPLFRGSKVKSRDSAEPMFQAAASGLWYENPMSCGEVSAITVCGKTYKLPPHDHIDDPLNMVEAKQAVPDGIEAAAIYLEKKAEKYCDEWGNYDKETGVTTLSPGRHSDYYNTLMELAEELRLLPVPQPEGDSDRVLDSQFYGNITFRQAIELAKQHSGLVESQPEGAAPEPFYFRFGDHFLISALSDDEWLEIVERLKSMGIEAYGDDWHEVDRRFEFIGWGNHGVDCGEKINFAGRLLKYSDIVQQSPAPKAQCEFIHEDNTEGRV